MGCWLVSSATAGLQNGFFIVLHLALNFIIYLCICLVCKMDFSAFPSCFVLFIFVFVQKLCFPFDTLRNACFLIVCAELQEEKRKLASCHFFAGGGRQEGCLHSFFILSVFICLPIVYINNILWNYLFFFFAGRGKQEGCLHSLFSDPVVSDHEKPFPPTSTTSSTSTSTAVSL